MALSNNGCFIISTGNTPQAIAAGDEYVAASIKLSFESLKSPDSGFTDDGEYHVNYVIKNRRVLEVTMPPFRIDTKGADMSDLITSIQGQKYYITYYDFVTKGEKTIHVYTDASTSEVFSGVLYTNGVWQGLTFIATEIKGETA